MMPENKTVNYSAEPVEHDKNTMENGWIEVYEQMGVSIDFTG